MYKSSPKVDRALLSSKSLNLETKMSNLKMIISGLFPNLDCSNITWDGKMGSKIQGLFCKTHPNPPKIWTPYLNNLLKGHSCSPCANQASSIRQLKDFVGEAKAKHGDKFDYSKTKYTGHGRSVIITCIAHNKEFTCTPPEHLNSRGGCCPVCREFNTSGENHPLSVSLKELELRIETIWGDRFDYDFTGYTCLNDYIGITCKECERSWTATATNHVHPTDPRGCITCGRKVCADKLRLTHEEFVAKSVKKHGSKYDYSKFEYVNNNTEGVVICKIHGQYPVTPADHFGGTECPLCTLGGVSKGEIEWLDYRSSIDGDIIYKGGDHKRQVTIRIDGKIYRLDGNLACTKIAYEFLGCWHHGCNKCGRFEEGLVHAWSKKTMKELNEKFQQRKRLFEENGYTVVSIWECEWTALKRQLYPDN